MANSGPNTNGSQFFICFGPTPHLNEKHTIYGRVISNYALVEQIENEESGAQDKPLEQVTIVDSGELLDVDKLNSETADFLSNYIPVPEGHGMPGHVHGPGCSHDHGHGIDEDEGMGGGAPDMEEMMK